MHSKPESKQDHLGIVILIVTLIGLFLVAIDRNRQSEDNLKDLCGTWKDNSTPDCVLP